MAVYLALPQPTVRGLAGAMDVSDNEIETRTCTLRVDEEGVLRIIVKPGARMELADAEENMRACGELCGERSRAVIVDLSGVQSVSRDARNCFSGDLAKQFIRANATLVGSPTSRLIGNFFLALNRPPYPIKIFNDESDALEWLRSLRLPE